MAGGIGRVRKRGHSSYLDRNTAAALWVKKG